MYTNNKYYKNMIIFVDWQLNPEFLDSKLFEID